MSLASCIADALLPRFCKVCGRRLSVCEQHLCAVCFLKMPYITYSKSEASPAERLLAGETELVRAASLFRYDKESEYRKVIYHLKYYGHPDVGRALGRLAAVRLMREDFFAGIDIIVPVPLARRKQRRRGYNQCDYIASGISDVTGIPIEKNAVSRSVSNQVQAKKGRMQRWSNAEGIFRVRNAGLLQGKHILIVDDVVTTGSTVYSLMDTVTAAADVRISVFTLGLSE